jgi:hypothetical protein
MGVGGRVQKQQQGIHSCGCGGRDASCKRFHPFPSLLLALKRFSSQSIFQSNDVKDHRYFHKRAYYLASLASSLVKSHKNFDLRYLALHGDTRLPILELLPKDDGSRFTVRLHPILSLSSFPFAVPKLAPSRSNVRITEQSTHPTPLYNTSLLSTALPLEHLSYFQRICKSCPAFPDAWALLRSWAKCRPYLWSGAPDFLGFVLAHLLDPPRGERSLPRGSGPLGLVKGCLHFLGALLRLRICS